MKAKKELNKKFKENRKYGYTIKYIKINYSGLFIKRIIEQFILHYINNHVFW